MTNKNKINIEIFNNDIYDIESPIHKDKKHSLDISVDCNETHNSINLNFTTRLAMFEFAKSLMHEAVFGNGWIEFNPYDFGDGPECVDGVRLTCMNTSIYASFPDRDEEIKVDSNKDI